MEVITSSTNAQIKHIKELQSKARARRESGSFVAEGRKLVEEACGLGLAQQIYLSESYAREEDRAGGLAGCLEAKEAKEAGLVRVVADTVFKTISDTQTPQGILAVVRQPVYPIEELLERETVRLLLLEDIRDPGNLGTMLRTAEGAGIDAVLMSQGTVDYYNPKVVRATMGSIFRVPFAYAADFLKLLQTLKQKGIHLFAAHLAGKACYDEITYPSRAAVLIGNEANGLTDEAAGEADCYVKIPMAGKVESLNAAVAAALLMYQMRRKG